MNKKLSGSKLQIQEVLYGQEDGTLYLTNDRILWVNLRTKVVVTNYYAEIKVFKLSQDCSTKVKMQIILNNNENFVYIFANHNGIKARFTDRDEVKKMLKKLIRDFRQLVLTESREKIKILSKYPNLSKLYENLVTENMLTCREFWSTYGIQYLKKNTEMKDINVWNSYLADVKMDRSSPNRIKFFLNSDIVSLIFEKLPPVQRLHKINVPWCISGNEFWINFFKLHCTGPDRLSCNIKVVFMESGRNGKNENKIKTYMNGKEVKTIAETALKFASDIDEKVLIIVKENFNKNKENEEKDAMQRL